jgi:hypothetical protein
MLLICIASVALLWKTPEFSRNWRKSLAKQALFCNGNDCFWVTAALQKRLTKLRETVDVHTRAEDTLFVAPYYPGILALCHRRTAVYDTFPVYPASYQAQKRMIKELDASKPPIAIVAKGTIDQRADLRFESNYRFVFNYLRHNYEVIDEAAEDYVFKIR